MQPPLVHADHRNTVLFAQRRTALSPPAYHQMHISIRNSLSFLSYWYSPLQHDGALLCMHVLHCSVRVQQCHTGSGPACRFQSALIRMPPIAVHFHCCCSMPTACSPHLVNVVVCAPLCAATVAANGREHRRCPFFHLSPQYGSITSRPSLHHFLAPCHIIAYSECRE